MELRSLALSSFHLLLSFLATFGSPVSSSSSSSTFSMTADTSSCQQTTHRICANIYKYVQMPNVYGDSSQIEAERRLDNVLSTFSDHNDAITTFFCTIYLPPCSESSAEVNPDTGRSQIMVLPCRPMCEVAAREGQEYASGFSWPVSCSTLPTENCYNYDGAKNVRLVKTSINAAPIKSSMDDVVSFAPLEVELGNDDGYEVEVVSLSSNQIPERRYDIADLGDPNLFQGWADVQGIGAANDYCRIVGKNKRKFLSCNLAGSTGQGHHYVSKLGLDVGHTNTWFMRDMDGDGLDDYCRCVGSKSHSKMTCMKAGERGFYGSTTQGGNQHTFTLPVSEGCYNKRINPVFGERQS